MPATETRLSEILREILSRTYTGLQLKTLNVDKTLLGLFTSFVGRREFALSVVERGGHWGLRYCGIGQFFMRYFGNFILELRYCGILQTCGMRFLGVLVDDFRYKNVSFTF